MTPYQPEQLVGYLEGGTLTCSGCPLGIYQVVARLAPPKCLRHRSLDCRVTIGADLLLPLLSWLLAGLIDASTDLRVGWCGEQAAKGRSGIESASCSLPAGPSASDAVLPFPVRGRRCSRHSNPFNTLCRPPSFC